MVADRAGEVKEQNSETETDPDDSDRDRDGLTSLASCRITVKVSHASATGKETTGEGAARLPKKHVRQGSTNCKLMAVPSKLTFAVTSERHSLWPALLRLDALH